MTYCQIYAKTTVTALETSVYTSSKSLLLYQEHYMNMEKSFRVEKPLKTRMRSKHSGLI